MNKIVGILAIVLSVIALGVSVYTVRGAKSGDFGSVVFTQDGKFNKGIEVFNNSGTSTIKARSSAGNSTCIEVSYQTSATTSQSAWLRLQATTTTLATGTTTAASGMVGYVLFSTSTCANI